MNVLKRVPGRPKRALGSDEQLYTEQDGTKKIKIEDGTFFGNDFDDALSNSDADDTMDYTKGNFEDLDEFQPRGWSSSSFKDKSKGRHDNSLSVLTRKFIQLIRSSPNLTVDLNDAVKELNVQKRRIYDITNVLEGIGFIQKVLKNKIKWIGNTDSFASEGETKLLAQELESLIIQEKEVMKWTNNLQDMLADLAKDESTNQYSFVTFDDIKAINTVANKEADQPFLVIRAPKGTLLEVPTAEPDGKDELPHKMKLTSENEEIFIYVVSNDTTEVPQQV